MALTRRRLVERREFLNLTQEQVAAALDVNVKTVHRYESGRSMPMPDKRERYAGVLGWSPSELALALSEDGQSRGHRGQQVLESLSLFAALEQTASQLWTFEPFVVPGLLQTAAYATAVEQADPIPSDISRLVELRLSRQEALARDAGPLCLRAVVDESALRRPAGGRKVMTAQLDHLAALGRLTNVDLRVLALDAGVFAAAFGAFTVLTATNQPTPYLVCVVDRTGFRYHEARSAVDVHADLFDHLARSALDPTESLDLIAATKERYQ